ncbi:MAG: phage head-tail adapter protein [Oscillospiraceae bacterium]
MNKEWSELNKNVQLRIKKKETFTQGIETLLVLRNQLMEQMLEFKKTLKREDFNAMPFPNAEGYHSKTIAYSLYHIFRIEDITANSLVKKGTQIFFANEYQRKMNSPIITTGNELAGQEIAEFSSKLDIDGLYGYISEVNTATAALLKGLSYSDLKTKMTEADRENLIKLKTVSEDENAVWLIDYWCGKDVGGLIRMPLSRHWIMYVEACLRIRNKVRPDLN